MPKNLLADPSITHGNLCPPSILVGDGVYTTSVRKGTCSDKFVSVPAFDYPFLLLFLLVRQGKIPEPCG